MVWNEVVCLFVLVVVGTVSAMPSDDGRGETELRRRESLHRSPRDSPVRGARPSFADSLPQHFADDFQGSPLAKSESQGFIVGRPSNFPSFQSIGGFGPMDDNAQKKSNFIPEIKIPSVGIPDISEAQPVLTSANFPSRKVSPVSDVGQLLSTDYNKDRNVHSLLPQTREGTDTGSLPIYKDMPVNQIPSFSDFGRNHNSERSNTNAGQLSTGKSNPGDKTVYSSNIRDPQTKSAIRPAIPIRLTLRQSVDEYSNAFTTDTKNIRQQENEKINDASISLIQSHSTFNFDEQKNKVKREPVIEPTNGLNSGINYPINKIVFNTGKNFNHPIVQIPQPNPVTTPTQSVSNEQGMKRPTSFNNQRQSAWKNNFHKTQVSGKVDPHNPIITNKPTEKYTLASQEFQLGTPQEPTVSQFGREVYTSSPEKEQIQSYDIQQQVTQKHTPTFSFTNSNNPVHIPVLQIGQQKETTSSITDETPPNTFSKTHKVSKSKDSLIENNLFSLNSPRNKDNILSHFQKSAAQDLTRTKHVISSDTKSLNTQHDFEGQQVPDSDTFLLHEEQQQPVAHRSQNNHVKREQSGGLVTDLGKSHETVVHEQRNIHPDPQTNQIFHNEDQSKPHVIHGGKDFDELVQHQNVNHQSNSDQSANYHPEVQPDYSQTLSANDASNPLEVDDASGVFYHHGRPYQYLVEDEPLKQKKRKGVLRPFVDFVKKLLPL